MSLLTIRRHERGQALVEYATVIALVGLCLVAILGLVGNATKKAFERTSSTVDRNASYPVGGGSGGGGGGGGVRVIPASAPGSSDSVEVSGEPGDDKPDSIIIAHNPR
jgi:Flp pilus assembly pilin Flp